MGSQRTRTSTRPPPFHSAAPCPYTFRDPPKKPYPCKARVVDVRLGGPLGSPASCSSGSHLAGIRPHPTPRATLKALPTPRRPPSPLRIRITQPPRDEVWCWLTTVSMGVIRSVYTSLF